MAIKVGMVSLGCAKNQVDGEMLMASLKNAGFELCDDAALADVRAHPCELYDLLVEVPVPHDVEAADAVAEAVAHDAEGQVALAVDRVADRRRLRRLLRSWQ